MLRAALVGHGVLRLLCALSRSGVAAPGALTVPQTGTLYCQGLELLPSSRTGSTCADGTAGSTAVQSPGQCGEPEGSPEGGAECNVQQSAGKPTIDTAPLRKYVWQPGPRAVRLAHMPHTPLTPPLQLWTFDFGSTLATGRVALTLPPAAVQKQYNNRAGSSATVPQQQYSEGGSGAPTSSSAAEHPPLENSKAPVPESFAIPGPAGSLLLQAPALNSGTLNSVALWFELGLTAGAGVFISSTSEDTGGGHGSNGGLTGGSSAAITLSSGSNGSSGSSSGGSSSSFQQGAECYWGQALLHTQDTVRVAAGKPVQLVASRCVSLWPYSMSTKHDDLLH